MDESSIQDAHLRLLFCTFHYGIPCTSLKDHMLELVSKELNHLVAILHVYAGGFEFYEVKKKFVIIFQKENGNTFTLLIIFIVKSLQK